VQQAHSFLDVVFGSWRRRVLCNVVRSFQAWRRGLGSCYDPKGEEREMGDGWGGRETGGREDRR
jgi:hypothetical protein